MADRFKSAGAIHRKDPAVIPCQHGLIYTVAPNALGALLDESASIVRQLRRIQGVTVKLIDGVMSALFPPILLAEVARVMQPLPRNESAPGPSAYRSRIR
jgi:hypothetical protein